MSPGSNVIEDLKSRGYMARIVPADRLADLREDIEAGRRDGLYDDELYGAYLRHFVFGPPAELRDAKSLVVMATAQSPVRFTFHDGQREVAVTVPPTYLHARETDRKAQETLAELLAPAGYRVAPAILPKKLLAVRSGLAAYGRNNVTYVAGLGSFHRLSAFYTDMPCGGDEWHELAMLDRCGQCRLCQALCPAGAIGPDRFLLRAERCIVFHNEKPSDVPFPAWMDPAWHNSLVGCMLCQGKCPENRGAAQACREGATFSADETKLLLAGTAIGQLPASLAEKLEAHDLADLLEVMPRNLGVLLGLV